uniref:Caspase-8-like n=1 Tax=Gadus morhua TaxID=8049 RepID=A0A8C4YZI4_GADMO
FSKCFPAVDAGKTAKNAVFLSNAVLVTAKMLSSMEELASRDHRRMDCFACVVLSHGLEGGVYGVDGGVVRLEKLKRYVDGEQCSSLRGKPKLFFIQACQGNKEEQAVPVPTDGPSSSGDIRSDVASAIVSIPISADFLTAMATTPSCVSLRDRKKGTWFIQSLCEKLKLLVPRPQNGHKSGSEHQARRGRVGGALCILLAVICSTLYASGSQSFDS